jgi:hypothetical protein
MRIPLKFIYPQDAANGLAFLAFWLGRLRRRQRKREGKRNSR